MKTITIGKMGNQPFKIQGIGVSKNHATLTIDDYGRWILADNNSTNGTFIRDERTGDLTRVGVNGVQVTEMTFIVLGSDNSAGCCFYAKHLINPGDFMEEHFYMRNMKLEFDKEEEKVIKRAKMVRLILMGIMLVALALCSIPPFDKQIDGAFKSIGGSFTIYRVVSLLMMGGTVFYDVQSKRSAIMKKRKLFNQCPNPECDRRLSGDEMENLMCSRCKK